MPEPHPTPAPDVTPHVTPHVHIAIVGSGFAGLGLAIRLRQHGIHDFTVFEKADEVGGTWRDNVYPGIQCDVPSHLYSFSFAPNPDWSRSFALGSEIQDYLVRCAKDYGVVEKIRFGHEILAARWDVATRRWHLATTGGAFTADILASGHGPLSAPRIPDIEGLDRFAGTVLHSAQWDPAVDLTGRRVAVVGTGASAIQIVPALAPDVERLTLFQRTPAWVVPRLDRALSRWERTLFRRLPLAQRIARAGIYWSRETLAVAMVHEPRLLRVLERIGRAQLRAQVADRTLRRKLTPDYTIGCKRLLLSNEFYPAVSAGNVDVVTEKITHVTADAVVTADGTEHEVDAVVLATGFHVTDHPFSRRVFGADGRALSEVWHDSMLAYLGTTVAGFPNLFLLVGPNTGLGHSSMIFMMESQFAYILDCLDMMERGGIDTVEVRHDAVEAFNDELARRLEGSVWNSGCASWYLDAGGRNTAIWPGYTWQYRLRTRRFDPDRYVLSGSGSSSGPGR